MTNAGIARAPASRFARILLVIVIVAFGVRVVVRRGRQARAVPDHGRRARSSARYPSQCSVGDQIFYNAEANTLAAGHGFVEPLWAVTHPGEKAPPAADHPPLTVIVLGGVNWLVEHPPLSCDRGRPLRLERPRRPLRDGAVRHRPRVA